MPGIEKVAINVERVSNGWAVTDHRYDFMHPTAVFNSARQLKTWLTRWVDETRTDHGLRVQNGDAETQTGADGSEIPVREPEPGEFAAQAGKTD